MAGCQEKAAGFVDLDKIEVAVQGQTKKKW